MQSHIHIFLAADRSRQLVSRQSATSSPVAFFYPQPRFVGFSSSIWQVADWPQMQPAR